MAGLLVDVLLTVPQLPRLDVVPVVLALVVLLWVAMRFTVGREVVAAGLKMAFQIMPMVMPVAMRI